jgi:hypothetical protein
MIRSVVDELGDLKSPETAYIVNPFDNIPTDNLLGKNEAGQLKIVQYTDSMQAAADELTSDSHNSTYILHYKVKGNSYYLQTFSERGVHVDHKLMSSDVGFVAHEVFHNYQRASFKKNPTEEQLNPMDTNELAQYPLTITTLATQVYLLDLFKDYPNNSNKEDALAALQKYVVVVEAMLEADKPMEHKTSKVYRHGLNQERGEGTAQYIDVLVERALLPIFKDKKFINNIPFAMDKHDAESGLAAKLTERSDVIDYFAFESFYSTGGSVMFLLNKVGYDFKNIENGTIPYEAALSLSGLDEQERSYLLDEIQASSAWQFSTEAATRYEALLDK